MDKVEGLEVSHSRRDLRGHVQQAVKTERTRHILGSIIGTLILIFLPQGFDPGSLDCGDRQSAAALGVHVGGEERPEVAVLQVLVDDALGLLPGAHAQHPGNVDVLQSSDDAHLMVELDSAKTNRQNSHHIFFQF